MRNKKHSYQLIYKTLPALLILSVFYTAAVPKAVFAFAAHSAVSEIKAANQDDFDKKFREGRDLIDEEEWARAAERFREAVEKYPDGKTADAAFYWLAFCHKKQKQFKQADAALDRLLERFPASSWVSDARVMKMEIAAPLGRAVPGRIGPAATTLFGTAAGLPATAAPIGNVAGNVGATTPGFYEGLTLGGFPAAAAARAPLDREDEIKIAAFQSLLAADPKRAIEAMREIFKSDSKASDVLKKEVLRVLRSPRVSRTETFAYVVGGSGGIGKEFIPLLRETLVAGFQNEKNLKIRQEIIHALGSLGDESSDALVKLYASESDREVKRTIINGFGGSAAEFYGFAINAAQNRKTESGVLLEIVRTEKDPELRRLAFANWQRFQNWTGDKETIALLANLYDSESDEAFKIAVIRAFAAAAGKQSQAAGKLMDIAKNDKSDKLRLEAIFSLRNSKDPEVLKFLKDLIN